VKKTILVLGFLLIAGNAQAEGVNALLLYNLCGSEDRSAPVDNKELCT
jgi:hypothetical protein